jgi:diguanylate cyclase (GGDEF)-like protein
MIAPVRALLPARLALREAVLFLLLYVAGAALARALVVGDDAIVMLWVPGAIAFALLHLRGLGAWPWVAVGHALNTLVVDGGPSLYMPFAMAANSLGAVAGVAVARRLGFGLGEGLTLQGARALAAGSIATGAASLPLGLAGLVLIGWTPVDELPAATMKWMVSNVFGVMVLAPALVLLWPWMAEGRRPPRLRPLPSGAERALWLVGFTVSLGAVAITDEDAVRNATAMLAFPTISLLWAALRLPPRWVAGATLTCALTLTWLASAGVGALQTPATTGDTLALLALLLTLSLAPIVLAAALEDVRLAGERAVALAREDAVTRLPNREGLAHAARAVIGDATRPAPLALLVVDIDNFRLINDAAGSEAGDEFLRRIGGLLRSMVGADALVGRLGGDQFGLLLRHVEVDRAEGVGHHLRRAIGEYRFAHGGGVISATASVGGVGFRPGQGGYETMLALAETACATVKESGGNRVRVTAFADTTGAVAETSNAMRWAVRLDHALRDDHFQLYCQSIVGLRGEGGQGRHLEILLRMVDPSTGTLLPPAQFVAAAEKFKMGPRLDRHVVDRTLAWFERHPQALAQLDLCAINLCAASVNDPGFGAFLRERFARSSVPPGKVCLEITETSAVRDLNDAQQFIAAARGLGCKLALDDFGAGFCSFAYLRRLDVDYFKIDGGFVRDIESSALSLSIVRSIAEIARSIDKQTIAEFVENDDVRLRLTQLGVDYGQGYGIDRPQPIDQYFLRPRPEAGLHGTLRRSA